MAAATQFTVAAVAAMTVTRNVVTAAVARVIVEGGVVSAVVAAVAVAAAAYGKSIWLQRQK